MADLFDRPLELWRPTAERRRGGGQRETYAQIGDEPLLAKVDQPSASPSTVGGTSGGTRLAFPVYFDGNVDVRRGDQLRDPEGEGGEVFRVESVVRPSRPVYTKATCELDQDEES